MLKDNQKVWVYDDNKQHGLANNTANSQGQLPSAIDACYDHDWLETLKIVKTGKFKAICN